MSILLKNVTLNDQITDILIQENIFKNISPDQSSYADTTIDCRDKAILPAFYNNHSHVPMSIFRGIGDDKELFDWLNNDIWPREAKLTPEMIYSATKFSILEMIKTGTTFFSDMYFCMDAITRAVADMKIRAALSFGACDLFDADKRKSEIAKINAFMELPNPAPELISKTIGIHAVYSASPELIRYNVELAQKNKLKIHIHACETAKEVADCRQEHGCSPIVYLDKLGALSENTILAHSVFLDDEDIKILAEKGVWLCTNPTSNYKLSSGVFMLQKLLDSGCKITLGTDGAASNNNLSMIEEMSICALSAKIQDNSPTAGTASDVFNIATHNGAKAFDINAGEIVEGKLADCILVDLNNHLLVPNYNLISNMVYSADSSCIDTLICNGNILMQNHHVDGEEELTANMKELSNFFKD
ncbi:MAG: amidohydrolase [Alphaproteobacteria bacterium]|nr:amidohydrolase [Alphaproteobacteria bacterium]